ncbi:MAG: DNA-binding transcriptional regulator [Planctomycetota bacterium]
MAKTISPSEPPFSVGVRIPPWTTFARGVYPGLMAYIQQHSPWRIETSENTTQEIPPVTIDEHWQGDGLIVFRCTRQEYHAWKRRGIRVVHISSEAPPGLRSPIASVGMDNDTVGRLAAEHLLGRGLSRFACWSDPTRRYSRERIDGFRSRLQETGYDAQVIAKSISKIPMAQRWKSIEEKLCRFLPDLEPPLGFFAKDDISAISVIRACQLIGLRVPEDVAVIGCNNDPAFVYTSTPSLTSVAYPAYEIGWNAAALLNQMLSRPDWTPDERTLLPVTQVVERQSTMVYGYEDPLVSQVWLFLKQNPQRHAVSVREVATHLAIAEPTLRRRFREATGRSVKSAIDETRLRRVQQLLQTSETPIKHIAFQCGFQASEDLSRFFRRQTGHTPTQWRAKAREGSRW